MPRISKARIVNFSYNDGNRLIADELFDFESSNHADALNVLVNLPNGGGKSVLVQLMMQPMLPKAKIAGRKIESFFKSAKDHYFVVLEWLKDNSQEKLLTGIAMATGHTSAGEEDTARGMSVKYYTFCTEYTDTGSPYSIAELPLSRKEKNRFVPAAFDEVRNFIRRSKGTVCFYSSDDKAQWKKKLADYGISQDEWRMVQELNAVEGGLGNFFGEFKNSDTLIEKLLIPTIERKQNMLGGKEDDSLITMLLSYAEQTQKNKTILAKKKTYETFFDQLSQLKPLAEALWEDQDEAQKALARLFGLQDALEQEKNKLEAENEKGKSCIRDLECEKKKVEWEKVSADYHEKADRLQEAEEVWQHAEAALKEKRTALEKTTAARKAQECAGYFAKQKVLHSKIEGTQKEIEIQESGGDRAAEIASLKYSAYCAAQSELEKTEPERATARQEKAQVSEQLQDKTAAATQAKQKCDAAQQKLYQMLGAQQAVAEETDRAAQDLKMDLQRRLDGAYPAEEVAAFEKQQQNSLEKNKAQQEQNKKDRDRNWEKQKQLPNQIAAENAALLEAETACEKLKAEQEEYREKERVILSIFEAYQLDAARRFSDYLVSTLQQKQRDNAANHVALHRKLDVLEEQIRAVDRGSVHVPDAVIQYLNATGIAYKTGEQYLQYQMQAGKLDRQRCLEILENYPAIAYGVLMDPLAKEELAKQERQEWLPAMVPIFDYKQVNKILDLNEKFISSIAFYAKAYFEDRGHYRSGLERQKRELEQERVRLDEEEKLLAQQMEQAKDFSYSADWDERQSAKIVQQEERLTKCRDKIEELKLFQQELEEEKKRLEKQADALSKACHQIQDVMQKLAAFYARMQYESKLQSEIGQQRAQYEETKQTWQQTETEKARLQESEKNLEKKIKELDAQCKALQDALRRLGNCAPAPQVVGEWNDLLDQYEQLQTTANQALSNLKQYLDDLNGRYKTWQAEIDKRGLPQEAYCTLLYSEEQEENLRQEEDTLRKETEQARTEKEDAGNHRSELKGYVEQAKNAADSFGGVLEKYEIGTDFDRRIQQIENCIAQTNAENDRRGKCMNAVTAQQVKLNGKLEQLERPEEQIRVALEQDYAAQNKKMLDTWKQCRKELEQSKGSVQDFLQEMKVCFGEDVGGTADAVAGMQHIFEGKQTGNPYYTLVVYIDGYMGNTQRAIVQIETDLSDFDAFRRDLIHQCTIQGEQIYRGLRQMEKSSNVVVHTGKPRQKMIRFRMPDEVDTIVAEKAIADEIDLGTQQLLELWETDATEASIRKHAEAVVGSCSLLHKYIGKDFIQVEAYKIDQNPQNSKYRTWENTQINNSGAEKFVVYFAVILALINYTRGDLNSIQDKQLHSALILDNPFGATSSEHILKPMFAIAKHFRVQMICLSDINKAEVINCFDIVIRAIVKQRALSSIEMLTHEGNEQIEHGYYRSEQISLLD